MCRSESAAGMSRVYFVSGGLGAMELTLDNAPVFCGNWPATQRQHFVAQTRATTATPWACWRWAAWWRREQFRPPLLRMWRTCLLVTNTGSRFPETPEGLWRATGARVGANV
jgi:hypothetical protein